MQIVGSADLRTDGVKRVRIARKLSGVEPQVQKRNFPSVEQIQDRANELRAEGLTYVNSVDPLIASEQDSPISNTIIRLPKASFLCLLTVEVQAIPL